MEKLYLLIHKKNGCILTVIAIETGISEQQRKKS
jgi:hypothetical protein